MIKIAIGNKRYSSWSLRPWLVLEHFGVPFEEIVIGLDLPDTDRRIRELSPSGRVPAIMDSSLTVWDSLAICEYLAETHPGCGMWPKDPQTRGRARSVSAEMHSGFPNLRNDCSMKILETFPPAKLRPETQAEVDRIKAIWSECLAKSGGPFLFGGHFCIADAMYAPVVSRFRTYGLPAEGAVKAYLDTIWNLPAMQAWVEGARRETLRAKRYET
jgi:glutathione S-transferase